MRRLLTSLVVAGVAAAACVPADEGTPEVAGKSSEAPSIPLLHVQFVVDGNPTGSGFCFLFLGAGQAGQIECWTNDHVVLFKDKTVTVAISPKGLTVRIPVTRLGTRPEKYNGVDVAFFKPVDPSHPALAGLGKSAPGNPFRLPGSGIPAQLRCHGFPAAVGSEYRQINCDIKERKDLPRGYSLQCTNPEGGAFPFHPGGMSGGACLDEDGRIGGMLGMTPDKWGSPPTANNPLGRNEFGILSIDTLQKARAALPIKPRGTW